MTAGRGARFRTGAGWAMGAALALLVSAAAMRAAQTASATTRDKVYSKAQAARGEKQYVSLCQSCHEPGATPPPGQKAGPVLVGDGFLTKWKDKTLGELMTQVETTMPNDGSAFLDDAQTADIVAYMLQANGFPDGPSLLTMGPASSAIVIVK